MKKKLYYKYVFFCMHVYEHVSFLLLKHSSQFFLILSLCVGIFFQAGVESKIDLKLQSAITTLGKSHKYKNANKL